MFQHLTRLSFYRYYLMYWKKNFVAYWIRLIMITISDMIRYKSDLFDEQI